MLNESGLAALIIVALSGAALPTGAHAGDGLRAPHTPVAVSAMSPDPDGTTDTVAPGENLPRDEVDARIGWLIQTYIMDARAALEHDHIHEAVETLARARSALSTVEQRSTGRTQDSASPSPSSLAGSLARADAALSAGDHVGADRALADSERKLRAALVDLDAVLRPQSVTPRYGSGIDTAAGGRIASHIEFHLTPR